MKTERLIYYRRLAHAGNKNAQRVVDAFDPDQPRDADGKWGSGGGSSKSGQSALSHGSREEAAHTERGNEHMKTAHEHAAKGNAAKAAEHYTKAKESYAAAIHAGASGHTRAVIESRIAQAQANAAFASRGATKTL